VRPLLETAQSAQEIQPNTINNLPLNWDKEYASIFSEEEQRALQIQAAWKLQVKNYHDSLGHCNYRLLAHSLKKMGVSLQCLLPYINTYKCNTCTANLGRCDYLLTPTTASTPDKDTITTPSQPTNSVILNPEPIIAPAPLLPLSLPEVPVVVTPVSTFVVPTLDVRADFADSCQIGRSGDRWFLLMVDKTTEYVSLYNTKTRSNPLALLKEYLTFTGRKIRYLLMDNAKEFHSEEMLAFCRDNGIIIQPVIAYNHTGMCRVESYIGVVKSHGRVSMLNANVPLRFHGDAVLDFCIKRNFTWYSKKGLRTKIPEPPIQFSGATNFLGPKNEFTSHQFETSVLEPPMSFSPLSNHQTVVKPRDSRLNFYEGPIPVSEFVNCAERGKLGVESSQSRASAGSTCLSVANVPPDYAAHIPPILGGHPVTASAAKPFFPERKASERERESGHSPRDDHTETKVATYEAECGAAPVRCLLTVQRMSNEHKREKTLSEFSTSPDVASCKTRVLNYWLGHICVCISV
jgi:hypothetical protein